MKKTIKLPESVTAAIFNQWRAKHGKLLVVEVEDENTPEYTAEGNELIFDDGNPEDTSKEGETPQKEVKTYISIFKQPNLEVMTEITKRQKTDEIGASKLMFNSCKLFVPEEVMNDFSLYLTTASQLGKLVSQKKSNSRML